MTRNKRDLAALERVFRKLGDVKISEAVQNLRNPRPGQPVKWDVQRLVDVFLGVEAIKAMDIKPTRAFHDFAIYSKLSVPQVKYAYREGRHIAEPFLKHLDESLDLHLNGRKHTGMKGNPRLRDFLRKLESRMTTPAIR